MRLYLMVLILIIGCGSVKVQQVGEVVPRQSRDPDQRSAGSASGIFGTASGTDRPRGAGVPAHGMLVCTAR